MLPKRTIGATGTEASMLILGGHSLSDLPGKKMPTTAEAVEILQFLYNHGLTHFDCTWKEERINFNLALDQAGLTDKLLPIVWHGWHNRIERTADEIVDSFHLMLKELGCRKAGMIVMNQWEHADAQKGFYRGEDHRNPFTDWFVEGFLKVKAEGLTDAICWAVEPGPLGEDFLHEIYTEIDCIAPFWNYRDRRNQSLVEFARDQQLGVYAIGPFRRGEDSLFNLPNINVGKVLRPWLKWVFQNPAVFGTAISLPSLEEAQTIVEALEGYTPLTAEEEASLQNLGLPVEMSS